jgi:hypothetical protein
MIEVKVIGRKDKADFPMFDMYDVPVKIDSGAYSSSIHCSSVSEVKLVGHEAFLEVVFLDETYKGFQSEKKIFTTYKKKKVKSSTGDEQERFFVKIPLVLFGEVIETDFSLTTRNGLKNPVLIGRKLLNKKFLIDTSKTNLSFREKKKAMK